MESRRARRTVPNRDSVEDVRLSDQAERAPGGKAKPYRRFGSAAQSGVTRLQQTVPLFARLGRVARSSRPARPAKNRYFPRNSRFPGLDLARRGNAHHQFWVMFLTMIRCGN